VFLENRTFYEIVFKNIVESERLQMTVWRMLIAFWKPKVTKYALRICNCYCFSSV